MVVPLEWIDAHPEYDWCRISDVTDMVQNKSQRADNAVHVLRTTWDRFHADS
jgi:hypothetical protein